MKVLDLRTNISKDIENGRSINTVDVIGSNLATDVIQIVNYVLLCSAISIFGIGTNIINLIAFYKQGLDTTINISFFSLAISDMCSLIMQLCYNIFVNPWLEKVGVPGASSGIQFIVGGVPSESFARITCIITVYITAERCLCIAFPLHVKQMITPRRTAIVMTGIYLSTLFSVIPLYCTTYVGWKFNTETNSSLLGLVYTAESAQVEGVVMFLHAITGTFCFLAVVFFTIILIKKLSSKNSWRKSVSVSCESNEPMSSRDRKTMTIVTIIATIVIICYTPSVLLLLVTFIEPEFSVGGKYSNLYISGWSFACVFECINSSFNIFLYYSMSTRYRKVFRELFMNCLDNKIQGVGTNKIEIGLHKTDE